MTRPTFLELFAAFNAHVDTHGAAATAKILAHVGGLDRFGLIDIEHMPADHWTKAIRALSGDIPLAELETETARREAADKAAWRVANGVPTIGISHAGMEIGGQSVAGHMLVLPPTRR